MSARLSQRITVVGMPIPVERPQPTVDISTVELDLAA